MPLKVGATVEVGLPLYGDCGVLKRKIVIADRGGGVRGAWREATKNFVRRNSTKSAVQTDRKNAEMCLNVIRALF